MTSHYVLPVFFLSFHFFEGHSRRHQSPHRTQPNFATCLELSQVWECTSKILRSPSRKTWGQSCLFLGSFTMTARLQRESLRTETHRRKNRRDQGRLVPQLLGSPLISIVVTRMQDLVSEFSKNYPRVILPDSHSGRGDPLPHPTPSPAFRRAQAPRCWDPNLGLRQLFSRGCAHALLTKI